MYKFLKVTHLVSRLAAFLPVQKERSEWLVVEIVLECNRTTITGKVFSARMSLETSMGSTSQKRGDECLQNSSIKETGVLL